MEKPVRYLLKDIITVAMTALTVLDIFQAASAIDWTAALLPFDKYIIGSGVLPLSRSQH